MGTHPSGMSRLCGSRQTLLEFLESRPDVVGARALARHGSALPFLFKVLSVRAALSIQSHPDRALARRLRASRPDLYRDANHKPEMTLALTAFEALCGFAPAASLAATLAAWPELRALTGEAEAVALVAASGADPNGADPNGADASAAALAAEPRPAPSPEAARVRALLKAAFGRAAGASPAAAAAAVRAAVARVSALPEARRTRQQRLVLRLAREYPDDVGVLLALFLNHVDLEPGEALPLPANEPHAYLSGDAVECMASSDNVIRAGLTPKPRDVEALVESLTYGQGLPRRTNGVPAPLARQDALALAAAGATLRLYRPGFEEFEVWRLRVGAGDAAAAAAAAAGAAAAAPLAAPLPASRPPSALAASASLRLPRARGPMLALLLQGSARVGGQRVAAGGVYLIAADAALQVVAESNDLDVCFAAAEGLGFDCLDGL